MTKLWKEFAVLYGRYAWALFKVYSSIALGAGVAIFVALTVYFHPEMGLTFILGMLAGGASRWYLFHRAGRSMRKSLDAAHDHLARAF